MPGPAAASSPALPAGSLAAPVMPNPAPPPAWPPVPQLADAAAGVDQLLAIAGDYTLPPAVAVVPLPRELRLPEIPRTNPLRPQNGPHPAAPVIDLSGPSETLAKTPSPQPLLPEPDPEPGVVYVVPFLALMVPVEVQERIFDQFVDTLNQRAPSHLKFVILKQGLNKAERSWVEARKYVTGEIYGYVEEAGANSTELRTRVRLSYFKAHQAEPALKFEYPTRVLFNHEQATILAERQKFADRITATLVDELLKALDS
jgi:hypothetical protein